MPSGSGQQPRAATATSGLPTSAPRLSASSGAGDVLAPALALIMGASAMAFARARGGRKGVQCAALPDLCEADCEDGAGEDLVVVEEGVVSTEVSRRVLFGSGAGAAAGVVAAESAQAEETKGLIGLTGLKETPETTDNEWVQYDLNTGETLYDIDFDLEDRNHGFIVGARGLFYETKDGGKRWVSRSFANLSKGDEINYRFQNVSVRGDDVWIVGKPPLLLHSKDGGVSWKKVPVSRKLPGEPKLILTKGPGAAEMATSSGAVYTTQNDGRNWSSKVKETVDATLNRVSSSGVKGASYFTGSVKGIKRSDAGQYLAVAQRGNFYLTFSEGEDRWVPHNRISARRIQAMGFRSDNNTSTSPGVWMSLNGGYLTACKTKEYSEMGAETKDFFDFSKIRTGGIGIIDLAFRTATEGWAVGGSGVIYYTIDGGKTWGFDTSGSELPCNLYNVKFFEKGKTGYMIGSQGILLRKVFEA